MDEYRTKIFSRILRNKIGSLPHLPTHFPSKQTTLPTPPSSSSSSAAMAYNSIYQVTTMLQFSSLQRSIPPCQRARLPPWSMQFEAGGAKSNWSDSQHPQHFPHSTYSPPISSPAPTVSNNNNPSPAKSEPPQDPPGTQQSHPSSPGGFKQWAPSPSADLLAPFHSYDQHQAAQNLNYYMYLQSQVHISFWLNSEFCLLLIQIFSSGLIVC